MRSFLLCWLALLFAASGLQGHPAGPVRLKLEQTTTLHIGQTAVLQLPEGFIRGAAAGKVLAPLKEAWKTDHRTYTYRAVRSGKETIITFSPSEMKRLHCVSCVTDHYFITVVP